MSGIAPENTILRGENMIHTTKLNKSTQKASRWIEQYNKSTCYSVTNFYGNCSYEKRAIEQKIKNKMDINDFTCYRVLSGNSFYFTCGYITSDKKTLFIETACNIFEIEL